MGTSRFCARIVCAFDISRDVSEKANKIKTCIVKVQAVESITMALNCLNHLTYRDTIKQRELLLSSPVVCLYGIQYIILLLLLSLLTVLSE